MDKVESIQCFDLDKFSDDEIIEYYKSTNYNCYRDELYRRYRRMFYRFSLKYERINPLFTRADLLQECYFIFIYALDYYDVTKENKASFTTMLFNFLNWKLNNLVRGVTEKQQKNYELYKAIRSLDSPIGEDGESTLKDLIEDVTIEENFNLPEKMFLYDLRKAEESALRELKVSYQEVIKALNGFDCEIFKMSELARMRGVTPERIRQIMNAAYRKLRQNKELISIWNEEFGSRDYRRVYKTEKYKELKYTDEEMLLLKYIDNWVEDQKNNPPVP